jgi:hypothetical protein
MKNLQHPKTFLAILPIALFALTVLSVVPVAHAYGKAQYQVTVSRNCNNPSLCGGSTGGDWGWCALGGSGSWADCQITGYGKSPGSGAGPNEAHISLDITSWTIAPCSTSCSLVGGNDFYFLAGTATIRGGSVQGQSFTVDACSFGFCGDQGIPAAPGHYDIVDLLGFSAPGIHFNIQVNQLS